MALCMAGGTLALSGPSVRPAESSVAAARSDVDVTAELEVPGEELIEIPGVSDQTLTLLSARQEVLAELDQASAELALEVALLTEELAALGPLLDRESDDPAVDAVVRRLLKRITTLSEASNAHVKTQDGEEADEDQGNF
ncbi:MAG: hypothetical protein ACKVII_11515 [Planctomycetales bacterium]|jgi:hypothetical protein